MNRLTPLILLTFLLYSCGVKQYIPQDEKMYTGAEITFSKEPKLKEEKKVRSSIESKIYPAPNRKLLGIAYFNLWVYFNFHESRDNWYAKLMYNRFAEEPVYLSDVNTRLVEQLIQKEMQDEGYFHSDVSSEVKAKKKSAKIRYKISPKKPTIMRNVIRPQGTTEIDSLIRGFRRMSVKKGERYRLEAFKIERNDVAEYIRSKGFYNFNVNDIYYLVDTTNIDTVDITMRVKKPEQDSVHRKFYIHDINVYTTNGALGSQGILNANHSYEYKGLNYYEDFRFIDKKIIASNILIRKNDPFSVQDYKLTLSRLINLNIFKYVNIQYEKVGLDSLDVNILLTPEQYKTASYEGEVSTSDRSFLGSQISASYSNNNTFRRAEKLSTSLTTGLELQSREYQIGISIFNINGAVKYEVPRLLVPFKTRAFRSSVPPKTIMSFQNEYQLWLKYFNVNSTNLSYGYEWNTESNFTFKFQPLFANFLNVLKTTAEFDSIAIEYPNVRLQYSDQLIIGSLFSLSHTNQLTERQRNSYVLRWDVETSGNTSTLITKSISGVPISQYFKTDIDYRFTRKFTFIENLITRINLGFVRAYGNSSVAPFTKQFYIGGPTTLRGFRFRSVGPGRYKPQESDGPINPIDQFGDIRLLVNTEYRFPIYNIFRGAVFFDAGNVWLIKSDAARPEGQFKFNTFFKELAWNTGFGLRADIKFIAARLDFGIPLYTPYEPVGSRWIHKNSDDDLVNWTFKNVVLSAGIGYPF